MANISSKKALFLWSLSNIFFAFQFILRLSIGLLREDIIQKFTIDSISFGILAGCYYLGYASAQIPIGIMLDRFNFRFITSLSIFTAAVGTFIFINTNNWHILLLSRLIVGIGSGGAFLSVAKIVKTCFKEKYHSFMLGFSFSFGLVGAVFGTTPMNYLFKKFGCNAVCNVLILIGLSISIMVLTLGKLESNTKNNYEKNVTSLILKLISNPKIMLAGLSGGLMVGSLEGFADVWSVPFFNQYCYMSKNDSMILTSFIYIGMCFGGPILAMSANLTGSKNIVVFVSGMLIIAVFILLFYLPQGYLSFLISGGLMFIMGVLCCYQVLVFVITNELISPNHTGLATAIINSINMLFGHLFHIVIGSLFKLYWNGLISGDGSPIYSDKAFFHSLAIIPICTFIGQCGFLLLPNKLGSKYS